MKLLINQSVAILCDGNNIERSIQAQASSNTMVNFDTLIPRLLNGRGLNRLIYFREGRNISSKLSDRLYEQFFGSVVPCHKSADIPLSIKATQLASKVDTIIILSGDSDYVDLVRHLKSEGVRVEIAAVKENSARILLDEADYFHPITTADWFEYTKPGYHNRRNNNNSNKPFKKDEAKDTNAESETKELPKEDVVLQTSNDKLDAITQKLSKATGLSESKQVSDSSDDSLTDDFFEDDKSTKSVDKKNTKKSTTKKTKKKSTKKVATKKVESKEESSEKKPEESKSLVGKLMKKITSK